MDKAADHPLYLKAGSIALLYLAIFSGRFSFSRFLDEASRVEWLELRFWFTALAFAGWLLVREKGTGVRYLDKAVAAWVALLALFYLYLCGNLFALGDPAAARGFVVDTVMLAVQLFLAFQLIESLAALAWFARAAVAVGILLFFLCLVGFRNPDLNGSAWAPFGGPITFYRIEFLAFCSALFLYSVSAWRRRWLHLLCAAACLFATLASLSKAAYFASFGVIALFILWHTSIGRARWAITIGAVAAMTYAVFHVLPGGTFVARVEQVGSMAQVGSAGHGVWNVRECPRADGKGGGYCFKDPKTGEILQPERLPEDQQRRLRALFLAVGYPEEQSLSQALEVASRTLVAYDSSGRLLMAAHAWQLFKAHPWFGVGVGNYDLGLINPYTYRVDVNRYPHNIVLEFAVISGLVGVGLFLLLVFFAAVLWLRRVLAFPPLAFLMGYVLFVFLTALSTGDQFDFRVFWLVSVLAFASRPASAPAAGA